MAAVVRQAPLPLGNELIVDLFAGGGGTSLGIMWGLGRPVDVAVNHDPIAVAVHRRNHPETEHFCESVYDVDPVEVTRGLPVGLLWASPDCRHHSKAKGSRPVSERVRGLAWVVVEWARVTRPRVIILENVEEFQDWGPVQKNGRVCEKRKGKTFRHFVGKLERQGYRVDWRELTACDYGVPTKRKRLFIVARRDGRPIVWPEPTHAPAESEEVGSGRLASYRTAADCIDWSLPCPSIFERKKPLADNTLERIALGVKRFVLEADEPFIVTCNHGGSGFRGQGLREPMCTITAAHDAHGLVRPVYQAADASAPRRSDHSAEAAAFMAQHNTGMVGHPMTAPVSTIVQKGCTQGLVMAPLALGGNGSSGSHAGDVAAFLAPYYGNGSGKTGRDLRRPAPTVTTKDRLQLVTVTLGGREYVIADIGMRMLQPRELFRAQGFPDDYVIAPEMGGRRLAKSKQVRLCGNSVPPQLARAVVECNFAHELELSRSLCA